MASYLISEICSLVKGTYSALRTEPGEYPLVVTAEFRRSASTYQIEGPAVCVPLISSTGHGDAALHRVHHQEGKFALANLLVALIPNDPMICYAKYLYYLLTAKKDKYLVPLMQGTANVSLKERDIASVRVYLPPLTEQRRIVARIEELATRVEEARGLRRETVEEVEMLRASATKEFFIAEKHLDWPTTALGDATEIRSGVTLGRMLNGPTVRLPYLRVANVQDGYLNLQIIKEIDVLESEVDKWLLQPGDILLTEGGDWDKLGRGTVWCGEIPICIHQNHIFRVRAKSHEFDPDFLATLIGSPYGKSYFQAASKQTTNLASINRRQLSSFKIFRPPLPEQRRIVAYLDELQARVNAVKQLQAETQAELDALLPSILDKAFRGELV